MQKKHIREFDNARYNRDYDGIFKILKDKELINELERSYIASFLVDLANVNDLNYFFLTCRILNHSKRKDKEDMDKHINKAIITPGELNRNKREPML